MMKVNIKNYVTVYEVTRVFGGHEEGGWYFDRQEPIESVVVEGDHAEVRVKADEILVALEVKYSNDAHGDISSVAGGREFRVYVEEKQHENEHLHEFYE